jgi:hypothetical protein
MELLIFLSVSNHFGVAETCLLVTLSLSPEQNSGKKSVLLL